MQKRKGNGASVDDVVIHLLHRVSQRADEIFAEPSLYRGFKGGQQFVTSRIVDAVRTDF